MNFVKKIVILSIVFLCVGVLVFANRIHNSAINVSNSPMKIVIDAGHGTYGKCFNKTLV